MSKVFVIYDGQCELCKNSVSWVQKKLAITALDFHTTELSRFNLTKQQCAREVFVITQDTRASGAQAVALLLNLRGNKVLAKLIMISGPIARVGYKWVAGNRNSVPVKILAKLIGRAAN
jgi:predicted DCC family thiol-disulfide oxidoreductase YuxK